MKRLLRRFRFTYRLVSAYWRKHSHIILTGFLIGIAFFSFFLFVVRPSISKKVVRVGYVGRYTASQLPDIIQNYISQGLTRISPNGSVEPAIAESWQTEKDGKEYVFTIKKDIFWQDRKLLVASDINYNFSDVATQVIDDTHIKFVLKEPFSPLPSTLSKPVFRKGFVGTGEYRVSKAIYNGQTIESITLASVKDRNKPILIFRFYPTEDALRIGFKLGEVDEIAEISSPTDLASWTQNAKITKSVKENQFVSLVFDTQNPKFGDKNVRQALAYAMTKRWENRAYSPINPRSWAYNQGVKTYDYDLERAKELLKKATDGGQNVNEIEISATHSLLLAADDIKKDWEALGINVKVKVFNNIEEDFEALLITQEIPTDPDQYIFWHSTQKSNLSHYKSPKIDKLLEDGRKSFDQEERKEIYQDFQRFLVEDCPVVFLFHPVLYRISRI